MWLFLLSVLTFVVCVPVEETEQQRVASLVVLPPLVLGYEDMYHDDQEEAVDDKPSRLRAISKDKSVEDEQTSKNNEPQHKGEHRSKLVNSSYQNPHRVQSRTCPCGI